MEENKPGQDLTLFQQSMRIVMDIVAQIQWAYDGIMKEHRIDDEGLKKTICFHIVLLVWEFNNEWRKIESFPKSKNDELVKALRIISPAIHRIRIWGDGLDLVRNQFLGHPSHRDNKGKFIPIRAIFENPKVPTSFGEMLLLGKLAEIAMTWLCRLNPEDYKVCTRWLESQGKVEISKGVRTTDEIRVEISKVEVDIRNKYEEFYPGNI